jgi:CheY-like chemotaxis protein
LPFAIRCASFRLVTGYVALPKSHKLTSPNIVRHFTDTHNRFSLLFNAHQHGYDAQTIHQTMGSIVNEFLSPQLVLIADDEPTILKIVGTIITRMGFTPLTVTDGAAAIKAMEDHHAHICCVILDIMMPILNGIDAAFLIQQIAPNIPIIIMSGNGMGNYTESIKDLRPTDMIIKPFTVDHFRASVLHATHGNALRASV